MMPAHSFLHCAHHCCVCHTLFVSRPTTRWRKRTTWSAAWRKRPTRSLPPWSSWSKGELHERQWVFTSCEAVVKEKESPSDVSSFIRWCKFLISVIRTRRELILMHGSVSKSPLHYSGRIYCSMTCWLLWSPSPPSFTSQHGPPPPLVPSPIGLILFHSICPKLCAARLLASVDTVQTEANVNEVDKWFSRNLDINRMCSGDWISFNTAVLRRLRSSPLSVFSRCITQ